MSRPKSPVPLPDHVKPSDLQRRHLQSNHVAEHANGHAKPAPPRQAQDDDYDPNIGG